MSDLGAQAQIAKSIMSMYYPVVENAVPKYATTVASMEDSSQGRSLARLTVMIFAPVLVATGVGGYLIPPDLALMSGETPYNLFHLFFGAIGLGLLAVPGDRAVRIYLVGFGTLDLYQALASWLDLWPQALFAWTWVDDVAHVGIGIALVALGLIRRGSVDQ